MASLNLLRETLGFRRAKHLLRRASFNYTKAQIDIFASKTPIEAFALLTNNPSNSVPEPYDPEPTENPDGYWLRLARHDNLKGNTRKNAIITGWWWHNAMQEVTLKHKLTFFLHTSFTVGKDSGAGQPVAFYDHLRLLDYYAFGNIKTLATKINLDNGMLRYLDNTRNRKNAPNENYAREFLELFTILKGEQIGVGDYTNYTEIDIQQAARLLTGYRKLDDRTDTDPDTGLPIGYLTPDLHDEGDKTFSAAFGNRVIRGRNTENGMLQELDEFVDMVFSQRETAKSYCRKLYRYFVKSTWDEEVENDIITPLAEILYTNNYEILPAVEALLCSQHFYDADDNNATDEVIGSIIKNPLQLLSEVFSVFNVQVVSPRRTANAEAFYLDFFRKFIHDEYFVKAGMGFFDPDSVAGYPAYYQNPDFDRLWFSSNTLIARYSLIEGLISSRNTLYNNRNIGTTLDTLLFAENNTTDPGDPNILVAQIAELLYPETISTNRIGYFKSFLVDDFADFYWTDAWFQYKGGDDTTARTRLNALIVAMVNAVEFQLM